MFIETPLLELGLNSMTQVQMIKYKKGKKISLRRRNLKDKRHYLNQMNDVN